MKTRKNYPVLAITALVLSMVIPLKAELLFDSYLVPSFDGNPNTEYSAWDIFYSPHANVNFPDFAAPNGTFQAASAAGFTPPSNSNPLDPLAFWHNDNPTITQTATSTAFIISPSVTGNIYSFAAVTGYELDDTTPYTVETVIFQFQTDGTLADFDSIRLVYNNGSGDISLPADEYIREYRSSGSGFGGTANRNALQWDLRGLGITTYHIEWVAEGSSMSLQEVSIDTAATYSSEVPEQRTWITSGNQNWGDTANWSEGTASQPDGNVRIQNLAAVTITDTAARSLAELTFESASDVQINQSGGWNVNTGITTPATATGTYTISGSYTIGAYNLFNLEAGNVVIDSAISGDHGFLKSGDGRLTLPANNTFGGDTGGITISGGTVVIEGSNTYLGGTSILFGDVVLAADAPSGSPGALGNATSNVSLGAGPIFAGITTPARIILDGDRTLERKTSVSNDTFNKQIGARNTSGGATVTGDVILASGTDNFYLFAEAATDTLDLSAPISGGNSGNTLYVNGNGEEGTVRFSGAAKTYSNSTIVRSGGLEISPETTVSSSVTLDRLSGSPSPILAGSGTITGTVTVKTGGILSPGNSPGTLTTGSQTWEAGAALDWEIDDSGSGAGTGWDLAAINGTLNITATSGSPFIINVASLDAVGASGSVSNFSPALDYSWKIAETTGGITNFAADKFTFDTSDFVNPLGGGTFSVSVENGGNDLHLNFTAATTPLNTWLTSNFTVAELENPLVSGDSADFDQDGLDTLTEYGLGGLPKTQDSGLRPRGDINDTDFGSPGDEFLTLSFTRLLDRTDINYVVKAGDSPDALNTTVVESIQGATPVGVNGGDVDASTPSGNEQEVVAADHERVQDNTKRFMTLRIERP